MRWNCSRSAIETFVAEICAKDNCIKGVWFLFQHHNILSAYILYVLACMMRILKSILYGYDYFLTLKTSAKSF